MTDLRNVQSVLAQTGLPMDIEGLSAPPPRAPSGASQSEPHNLSQHGNELFESLTAALTTGFSQLNSDSAPFVLSIEYRGPSQRSASSADSIGMIISLRGAPRERSRRANALRAAKDQLQGGQLESWLAANTQQNDGHETQKSLHEDFNLFLGARGVPRSAFMSEKAFGKALTRQGIVTAGRQGGTGRSVRKGVQLLRPIDPDTDQ